MANINNYYTLIIVIVVVKWCTTQLLHVAVVVHPSVERSTKKKDFEVQIIDFVTTPCE